MKPHTAVNLFGFILIIAVAMLNSCAMCVDRNTGNLSFYREGTPEWELAHKNDYCKIIGK